MNEAKQMYDKLPSDIQIHFVEEYIKPQLNECDAEISLFNKLLESEECQRLNYYCLIEPLKKIINNEYGLAKMRKLNKLDFDYYYTKHFIEKKKSFELFTCPYASMALVFLMMKYH